MAVSQPVRRKAVRIGVIGAGSAQFSLGLVRDLCLTESLAGSQVVFMDVDADRLDLVGNLAARYAREVRRRPSLRADPRSRGCPARCRFRD